MASATKTRQKIQLLEAIISHKNTGDAERDAAERAIRRVLASPGSADGAAGNGWVDPRVYGAKFDQTSSLTLAQITKLMRDDIKLARKLGRKAAAPEPGAVAILDALGTLPAGIAVSVRKFSYSGGGSIDITVRRIPAEWGFVQDHDRCGRPYWAPSPALSAVLGDLQVIFDAYNYDGSDPQSDYFDARYLGGVEYEHLYDRAFAPTG